MEEAALRLPSNLPEGGGELGVPFPGFMSLQGVTLGGLVEERSEHKLVMNWLRAAMALYSKPTGKCSGSLLGYSLIFLKKKNLTEN